MRINNRHEIACPHCEYEIDTDEPSSFVNDIYDGNESTHDEVCNHCKKDYVLVAKWSVTFEALTPEDAELL